MLALFHGSKTESKVWAGVTTTLAFIAVARATLPPEYLAYEGRLRAKILGRLDPYSTYIFHEFADASPDQARMRLLTCSAFVLHLS